LQELDNTEIPVIPSEKPTMVFESMGVSNTVMENVYNETKKYKGNTVCVFGLNKKLGTEGALVKASDRNEIPHHLVNFSFEWSKPVGMDASKGYEMPFIEARHEIMRQAQRLVFKSCENVTAAQQSEVITPTEEDLDMSWNTVYRWIDGDAKDDSSDELDTAFLRAFSRQGNAYIATGAYKWRHESDDTAGRAPNYHDFITLLNEKETFLRETYMRCMHEETHVRTREGNAYSFGDFYLPESTFLMNWAAHNALSSDRNEINPDGDQTRESMRFFNASEMTRDRILYNKRLHVTKPLKREFSVDGYAKSLMQFFSDNIYSREKLATALRELRQSAFGRQWEPKGSDAKAEYTRHKEECIDDIDAFLRDGDKFASIREEIRTM